MAEVMMRLGEFSFSIDTAAYQQLMRVTRYRWSRQSRVGTHDALQFTGYGGDQITLTGKIYPGWRGGAGQIREMRAQAAQGKPMMLVDGNGYIHGRWAVESVEEQADIFAPAGVPRRQQFTLQMEFFDDGPQVSDT
ncbi:phage tail protein [Billgrantia pellis]|uniref:Phage tail protein n=1 Tax=Billgrantia pellis TaxID=2606936 RepID=A0A7V7G2L7_9GAMM|nr:phage tail protein [Halomonas pellis]KAA0014440.1 phage tail protein [Halomonas pellis]